MIATNSNRIDLCDLLTIADIAARTDIMNRMILIIIPVYATLYDAVISVNDI